jgi:hypothetical protein
MKSRPVAVALLLALAPASLVFPPTCRVCRAQGASDDATTTMARARFKEGVEYFDKGQFELARAAFLQAYALKKHPAVLLNLAWSCLKSGHALEGERYFKQFLAEGSEISDKQRADANDGLNQAHARLGRIEIAAAPAGTDVSIDGESQGATPLADPVFVEVGAHAVKLRAPDGAVDTENVTATAGAPTVVRFARPAAPVQGAVTPPAAPAAAATAPTPATPAPPEPAPAPTPEAEKLAPAPQAAVAPAPAAAASESDQGMSIVPFVVGGVLVAAGATVAVVMKIQRDSAQHNADVTAQGIAQREGSGPHTCTSTSQNMLSSGILAACATWQQDNNYVNEDATIGNIAIGVGAAAAVGTLIYGIVYATHSHGSKSANSATVTPLVGPSFGGLSLTASF